MKADITKALPLLIEIARRAIDVDWCEFAQKAERDSLNEAYDEWKAARRIDRVEFNTLEWEAMKEATAEHYANLEAAKRHTYNAKRRLRTAILRFNSGGLSV